MKRFRWTLLLGILAVSLSLRPAVASVSPVLEAIRDDLGLTYAAVSLLTTIPTLCMGVFALTTPTITARFGRERGVFWGVVLTTAATAVRLHGRHAAVLFGSTIAVGIGIAVTQSLLPSLVSEYFDDRRSFVTGLYTASLTVGAVFASGLTAPIGAYLGSWPAALASWALLSGLGIPLWYRCRHRLARRETPEPRRKSETPRATVPWRNRWAIVLTLFFGGSSTVFFLVLTWLAPRYVALGWGPTRAGLLLSVFLFTQLGGNLAVSAVGDRLTDHRPLFGGMTLLVIGGSLGVAFAPLASPWLWTLLLGVGAGGVFTLALTLPITYAADPTATDGLTSMMFGGGYPIAALGPFVSGLIRDVTGSFSAVFGGLVVLAGVLLGVSLLFDPNREPVRSSQR